jgi:hypothetical protein
MPSETLNAAATWSPCSPPWFRRKSFVSLTCPTSVSPRLVDDSKSPGVTHFPVASMRRAPAGMATPAPTATMRPSRITTVPPGIGAPVTG